MDRQTVRVRVAEPLRFLLAYRHRHGDPVVPLAAGTSLGIVESLGVPRTEIGQLLRNGAPVPPGDRPAGGDVIEVLPVSRPQPISAARFVLDVHFGTLARRMRLLGLDCAYRNDASDPELVEQAISEDRVLLTQDRGLLRRRALPAGAYVRGANTAEQLGDVLDRFDLPFAPWSRCPSCNGTLEAVEKERVLHLLEPGTRRSYVDFARCDSCGRPYWRGAHADRLESIVTRATAPPAHDRRVGVREEHEHGQH